MPNEAESVVGTPGMPYVFLQTLNLFIYSFIHLGLFIYLFISPQDLRAPSADRCESLPRDRYLGALHSIVQVQKFRGPPQEIWGPKHAKLRSILYNFKF